VTVGGADPEVLARAASLVRAAGSVVVLTGAGISTDAGIPDFRGPKGVWTLNPGAERMATLRNYLEEAEVREAAWQSRVHSPVWKAVPTPAHLALVALERSGRLHTIVTQNTDGLHLAAGSSPSKVVEVHGTAHWCVCWECGDRQRTLDVLERVRKGEDDPRCRRLVAAGRSAACGGILKTATVSFGQSLNHDDLERARQATAAAELLLVIGTTLEVQPIAGMVPLASRLGKAVVIVNGSPTAHDSLGDVVVRGPISDVIPTLVGESGSMSGAPLTMDRSQ
jgi:NAD-dependent deacetylase